MVLMRNYTRREIVTGLASGVALALAAPRVVLAGGGDAGSFVVAEDSDVPVDGKGATVFISHPIVLRSGHYANIKFAPAKGYEGPGPIFMARDGKVIHENISVCGFKGPGCKVLSSSKIGNSFIAIGNCTYSDNGSLKRTVLSERANMRFSPSIKVDDASLFNAGDFVWIGDGKYRVREVDDNHIFFVMDGAPNLISPKVFSGAYDRCNAGQFVTLNEDDNNGIRIGDGGYGWDIDTSKATINCSNNGRSGFYHSCKKYNGKQIIENITAVSNGYINIGLGFMNKGWVRNCIAKNSSNNCIDIFESKNSVDVYNNIVSGSGVDGIFIGGNGQTARVYDNHVSQCRRVGILINARTKPIENVYIKNNKVTGSGANSITLTAVESGLVTLNTFDGSIYREAVFLERRNGLSLSGTLNISDNTILNAKTGDVGSNYHGYSKAGQARVMIKSTRKLSVNGIDGY